jgi:hypothetical protein
LPRLLAQHRRNHQLVRGEPGGKARHIGAARRPQPIAGDPPMTSHLAGTDFGPRSRAAAILFGCLLPIACAQQSGPPVHWVKAGVDDATTARELQACRHQANAAFANQEGINEDITATLGGNWQRSSTLGIETQSLNRSAADAADQAFGSCMRAKGFKAA